MALLFVGLLVFGFVKYRQIEDQRAADKLASQQRELDLKKKAEGLEKLNQARRDVEKFRNLAEEARFFAATTDPVAERAPYFDPREGQAEAQDALALAVPWGPTVEALPLEQERDPLRKDLYDLRLLVAQSKIQQGTEAAAKEALVLLDEAGTTRQQRLRGWYGLQNLRTSTGSATRIMRPRTR